MKKTRSEKSRDTVALNETNLKNKLHKRSYEEKFVFKYSVCTKAVVPLL